MTTHNSAILALSLGLFACTSTVTDGASGDGSSAEQPGVLTDGGPGSDDVGPGPDDAGSGPDAAEPGASPMITTSFTASDEDFLNPERGYYVGVDLLGGDADQIRSGGNSLAIALVRLDDYRDRPLDAAMLDGLAAGFAGARAAGIKVVLRFMYNSAFAADASRQQILEHIAQLTPLLETNVDVIAVMQAGFIGAWGEWHGSTHGLDNDADRGAILHAMLDALPESRAVQIRTPMHKDGIFPGGPINVAEAFDRSDRARVGHHNDCFLASDSDYGTYDSPVATWRDYVAADGRFTPIGGETCAVFAPRSDCASALAEMEANHWSYLNQQYNQAVLGRWSDQGCAGEIRRRLGYRFALERVAHSEAAPPGGVLDLEIDIANRGFAAPYNLRSVHVVLRRGGYRRTVRLDGIDARAWAPGETATMSVRLRIPADAPPGNYELALWLPDDADSLRDDSAYAVRFANEGVWVDATGDNLLTQDLLVDPSAPGTVDPGASVFAELH